MSKKPIHINADKVLSISAIIISVATLLLIFYQTDLIRKQQKASVFPSLSFGYNKNTAKGITAESIFIMNQGLGPAFIRNISIEKDKKNYDLGPYEFLSQEKSFNREHTLYIDKLFAGRIIPADEKIVLVARKTDSLSPNLSNIFDFHFNMADKSSAENTGAIIKITYENVYGDEWTIRSNKATTVELE